MIAENDIERGIIQDRLKYSKQTALTIADFEADLRADILFLEFFFRGAQSFAERAVIEAELGEAYRILMLKRHNPARCPTIPCKLI